VQRALLIACLACSCTAWRPADERRDAGVMADAGDDAGRDRDAGSDAGMDAGGECPAVEERPVIEISEEITEDTFFGCRNVYRFREQVVVTDAEVTVAPGAVLRFDDSTAFIFQRGARLRAIGTREAPIRFTSNTPGGSWVGVALAGRAPVQGEEAVQGPPYETSVSFGGNQPEYDCGTLQYVRIVNGGGINDGATMGALALEGCGTGTTIDHVQIHNADFEGLEVDGGRVRLHHIAITNAGDESIRVEDGWIGGIQHLLVHCWRGAALGIELDSDEGGADRTQVYLVNATFIGEATRGVRADRALEISTGAGMILSNAIVQGWRTALDVDEESWPRVDDATLRIERTFFWNNTALDLGGADNTDPDPPRDEAAELITGGEANAVANPNLTSPLVPNATNYEPTNEVAASVGCPTDLGIAGLDEACYAGAFERDGDAWLERWTAFEE
jgi:hypothetical protein